MDENTIRSIIFLVAGLLLIIFPKAVLKFQIFVLKKLPFKIDLERKYKYHPYLGGAFIVVSVVLFVYSIIY